MDRAHERRQWRAEVADEVIEGEPDGPVWLAELIPEPETASGWGDVLKLARSRYCSHIAMRREAFERTRAQATQATGSEYPGWPPGAILGIPVVIDAEVPDGCAEIRWRPHRRADG